MIYSMQQKVFLFLLLLVNVTVPMEDQFLRNITQQDVCPVLFPAEIGMPALSYQQVCDNINNPSWFGTKSIEHGSCLALQILSFADMRGKSCLFGTELIPAKNGIRIRNTTIPFDTKQLISVLLVIHLMNTALFAYQHTSLDCHLYSELTSKFTTFLLAASSMIHTSNFVYDNALVLLKKMREKAQYRFGLKNRIDITALPDAKCYVCYDDQPANDKVYTNICAQEDHILCTTCLKQRFFTQTKKHSFANEISFFCDACVKEVPFDNNKIILIFPPELKKVTLKLWNEQIGVFHTFLYLLGIYTIGELLYPYLV